MRYTSLLSLFPGPLWPSVIASDRVLMIGQIDLICILKPHWIVWNRTVFDIKTAYLFWHQTVSKQKTIFIQNWIVWNGTVYMYKINLALNNRQWWICYKTKPNRNSLATILLFRMLPTTPRYSVHISLNFSGRLSMKLFGFVSLFNGISTLAGYLIPKPFLLPLPSP